MLNQKYIECLSPSKRPRQSRGTTSRGAPSDPYAIQLPVCPVIPRCCQNNTRRLFANKPRARAFISPPGGNPFPLFVQSSRSKAFKVISVNWREKNWPIVDDTIGLVSTVGTVYRPGSRSRNRSRNRLRGNCAVTVRG